MRHAHINADGETKFHDHPDPTTTHYPGEGLDAATEAFNAYKLWREKKLALSNEAFIRYASLTSGYHQSLPNTEDNHG